MSFRSSGLGKILASIAETISETFSGLFGGGIEIPRIESPPPPAPPPDKFSGLGTVEPLKPFDLPIPTGLSIEEKLDRAGYKNGEKRHMDIEFAIDTSDGETITGRIKRYNYFDENLLRRIVQSYNYDIDLDEIEEMRIWVDDFEFIYDEGNFDFGDEDTPGGSVS